jgi:FKBP-type peptidyl-prolyl cis-trans isomerase SlyD
MKIAKHTVVTIDYTLTDKQGAVLDTSKGGEPLAYIQGIGSIIPGLEAALEGKTAGDALQVSLAPEDAYGLRDESLQQVVSRKLFNSPEELEVGMQFHGRTEAGSRLMTIVGIDGDQITIDGNHPLAGETLNFDVSVLDVRAASAEELSHGHAHGAGGHGH